MSAENRIYNAAISSGAPENMARLLVAQSKHETGNYTSNAFKVNNNAFGYKRVTGSKFQAGAGIKSTEGDAYAKYNTVEDSVHEVVAWLNRRVKEGKFPALVTIQTPEQYAKLLKKAGYYGAPLSEYINGLKKFITGNLKVVAVSGVSVLFFLLTFLIIVKRWRR